MRGEGGGGLPTFERVSNNRGMCASEEGRGGRQRPLLKGRGH